MKKDFLAWILSFAMIFGTSLPVSAANETTITNDNGLNTANIAVDVEVASVFSVGIPTNASIDPATNTGSYQISIKGDLDSNYKLVVNPTDEYTVSDGDATNDINFYLKDKTATNNLLPHKDDILVKIVQEQTEFVYDDLSLDEPLMVNATLEAQSPITAGNWSSVVEYKVSLVNMGTETANPGTSNPQTLAAGLYDTDDNLLCAWEESGINVEIDYDSSNYETEVTSPYYVITNYYPNTVKVIMPDSITKIGCEAFYRCESLTSITLPNNITNIGFGAFEYCTSLKIINIPDSVTNMGLEVFCGCTDLSTVVLPNNIDSIPNNTFSNCTSLKSITIPGNVKNIEACAFYHCASLTSITIPNSVITIGDCSFDGCSALKTVTMSDNITNMGSQAFYNCTALESIKIPNSVTSIGPLAFANCTSLNSAIFDNTSNWYVGDWTGAKTTEINSTALVNTATAAAYLNTTYNGKYWTRDTSAD